MWPNWIFSKLFAYKISASKNQSIRSKNTRIKGIQGEHKARKHLKKHGYKIIDANFNIRGGEIDIIARKKAQLVFVEVKASSSNTFDDPLAWIPSWKQKRIVRASVIYLKQHRITDTAIRFDVITINADGKINHIEDAFRPTESFFL